ncbi:protein of unknown function [Candidatus Nitrotoga arctica]|uniref:Uncharacterized protein n=1 Tax=Candidatus Nitrotoga arctica TaxID=453162 RepID=A0ABM8Z1H7_9PROT|nr:protein of unknown function [Candidatus Nitrotoga arctica]
MGKVNLLKQFTKIGRNQNVQGMRNKRLEAEVQSLRQRFGATKQLEAQTIN